MVALATFSKCFYSLAFLHVHSLTIYLFNCEEKNRGRWISFGANEVLLHVLCLKVKVGLYQTASYRNKNTNAKCIFDLLVSFVHPCAKCLTVVAVSLENSEHSEAWNARNNFFDYDVRLTFPLQKFLWLEIHNLYPNSRHLYRRHWGIFSLFLRLHFSSENEHFSPHPPNFLRKCDFPALVKFSFAHQGNNLYQNVCPALSLCRGKSSEEVVSYFLITTIFQNCFQSQILPDLYHTACYKHENTKAIIIYFV